jgi:hypothetical protein
VLRGAAEGKNMNRHRVSASGDRALRESACRLPPNITEGAIKKRYEESTNFVGRERSVAAGRLASARKRNSIDDADPYVALRIPRRHDRVIDLADHHPH